MGTWGQHSLIKSSPKTTDSPRSNNRYDVIDGMLTNHAILPVPHLGVSGGIRGYQRVSGGERMIPVCHYASNHNHPTTHDIIITIRYDTRVRYDRQEVSRPTSRLPGPTHLRNIRVLSIQTDTYSYSYCYFRCFGLISV